MVRYKIIHNLEVKFQNLLMGENKEVKSKVRITKIETMHNFNSIYAIINQK
jgi:hypothetical protein